MDYPEIAEGIFPRHRFMSAYEQKVDHPTQDYCCLHILLHFSRNFSCIVSVLSKVPENRSKPTRWSLLIENGNIFCLLLSLTRPLLSRFNFLTFSLLRSNFNHHQVPSREVDKSEQRFWSHWNKETKEFFLQFSFKLSDPRNTAGAPRPPPPAMVCRLLFYFV